MVFISSLYRQVVFLQKVAKAGLPVLIVHENREMHVVVLKTCRWGTVNGGKCLMWVNCPLPVRIINGQVVFI